MRNFLTACFLALVCLPATSARAAEEGYDIGGPLAGVKLPLYPTHHGEPAGYPGCLPDPNNPGRLLHGKQGLAPEVQLHPESVEHWRANDFKYLPTRSLFDRQTLLKNWKAPQLTKKTETYAEPVYWVRRQEGADRLPVANPPVPVARWAAAKMPAVDLDCGELPAGMYLVKIVGAVETKELIRHRKPLYVKMTVNDGLKGEESVYRQRCGYVDEFYSVMEMFFHAPERRAYRVKLSVDEGSQVDLLVHNVELHDVLAGRTQQATKQKSIWAADAPVASADFSEARWARDEELWGALTPINAQMGYIYGGGKDDGESNRPNFGAAGKSAAEVEAESGAWAPVQAISPTLMVNRKLNAQYTVADLAARRPLPDPYPYKDDGCGLWFPPAGGAPQNWIPIAQAVSDRITRYSGEIGRLADRCAAAKDPAAGRDAAVMLARWAYDYPSRIGSLALGFCMLQPAAYNRDWRHRQRNTMEFGSNPDRLIEVYDRLYPLIRKDQDLAKSLNRFVPWVKTPEDVTQLLDVYLVQELAKRVMRYHSVDANNPARLASIAALAADPALTAPWMEWVFSRTWIYPLSPSGVADLMVTGCDRDGMKAIGSFYYAQVEESSKNGELMEAYIAAGGDPKYDLRDPHLYPKTLAACQWFLRSRIAGLYFPRIGDVTGPVASYGYWLDLMEAPMRRGWRWTREPQYAWMLKHVFGRKEMTDAEWAEVEQAAAKQARAPWLEARSRVLSNWFGVLESGAEHDDFRFRRAAFVRIGQGWGHGHADTLDMQFYLHGLPMTLDGGARPGYSSPGDIKSRVHNVVEVDGADWWGHAWVNALTDAPGARYLSAEAEPLREMPQVRLHRRQLALIDVDEGQGDRPLNPTEVLPSFKGLDPNAVTANSYIFDVVRVAGGSLHTYCFHGPCRDDAYETNVLAKQAFDRLPQAERDYLARFPNPERAFGGDAPETVIATWRYPRAPESDPNNGCEQHMARTPWTADIPRKFTRLHLLGQAGARVLGGYYYCKAGNYGFDNLYTQRRGANLESVFSAIIEPYAGSPFILSERLLPVPDNETDAWRAVAVEVKLVNGRTDLCFADGRPQKVRTAGAVRVAGEFAYVSVDKNGLRQATLTGGTLLSVDGLEIRPAVAERTGKVLKADYRQKTMSIDHAWPGGATLAGRVFEVGVPGHWTTFTLAGAQADGRGSTLTVTGGADFYLARVLDVDEAAGIVTTGLGMPYRESAPVAGLDKHWVATNEDGARVWRAEYLGGDRSENRYQFKLSPVNGRGAAAVTEADFGRTKGFRLWEYGVGDIVRQSTFVNLRRLDPGGWDLAADVDLSLRLPDGTTRRVTVEEIAKSGGTLRIVTK